MIECIEDTVIPVCTVGLLYALPATQLGRRLLLEGRLFPGYDAPSPPDTGDQCTLGRNFETKRTRRDVLADYGEFLNAVYHPSAYFGRVQRVGRMLRRGERRFKAPLAHALRDLLSVVRLVRRLPGAGPGTVGPFLKSGLDCPLHHPRALRGVGMLVALSFHHRPFSPQVVAPISRHI